MTSSTSTGRCPSCIVPPPSSSDPERTLEAHVVLCRPSGRRRFALDSEPGDGLGEGCRILEAPAVRLPSIGSPDLGVIAGADDHGLGPEAGHLAEVARDQDAALAVEAGLARAGEDEPL